VRILSPAATRPDRPPDRPRACQGARVTSATSPAVPADRPAAAGPLVLAVDEGHGPLVVLLHGFPELPSCWHRQVGPLRDAGYRVVAPYLRGYGDSPAPSDPAAYTLDLLADDVAGVIERAGEQSAVVIGHDWGAATAWATAQLRPERVRAIAALSVPYTTRSQAPPIERLTELMGDSFFYMVHFQAPGVADAELAGDVRGFLLGMYAATSGQPPPGALAALPKQTGRFVDQLPVPAELPAWLDPGLLEASVHTFTRTGFTGGLNYYRAMDPSWHRLPQLADARITCPAAFLAGAADLVLAFTPTKGMVPPYVTDLRVDERIPGVGHWVQQEAPERVTATLLSFLAGL